MKQEQFKPGQRVVSAWVNGKTLGKEATVLKVTESGTCIIRFDERMKGGEGGSIYQAGADYDLYSYDAVYLKSVEVHKAERKHGVISVLYNPVRGRRRR